ncbi:MAG: hypothetical protein ABIY51_04365 [Ferruginibacter sp.]
MKRCLLYKFLLVQIAAGFTSVAFPQSPIVKMDSLHYKELSAGPQYKRPSFYQWLWGTNYRKEWTRPVTLPVLYLDTLRGGLISIKEGGSNQSKSLQLKTAAGKEYALRSVDKSLDKVIPDIFENTFVTDIVNDEISMSHPYGALGVPHMAKAIGINHSIPQYYYLPQQKALDSLKKKYAGKIFLLEQRPKDDWSDADNLGNFKEFESLEEMFHHILKDNHYSLDQEAFARARLFDMLIGDYDRHGDQWKWGIKKEGEETILVPVPTDRDQAFSTASGLFLKMIVKMAGLNFINEYDDKIQNVKAFARINRLIDRLATNKLTKDQWLHIAKDIQNKLTDSVIETSIKGMPSEIFTIRGNEIISKLKSRRNKITEYATDYYGLMAEEAEVVGTAKDEYFEINNQVGNVAVKIFRLNKNGERETSPFYSRIFSDSETDELRVYGIAGNDVYAVDGKLSKKINMRIIGGPGRDSIFDNTTANGSRKLQVYDNPGNYVSGNGNHKLHFSKDSAINNYNYNSFKADKKGLSTHPGYNDADRIYVGLKYQFTNYKWRKKPFASKQSVFVDYSINQKAFSSTYNGLFPAVFSKWDLVAKANYDKERWINFHGLGNETQNISNNLDFYRMRSEDASANLGVVRSWGKSHMGFSGFYQRVKIKNDTARFIYKVIAPGSPGIFTTDNFTGAQFSYDFADVKDSVLPQKGITFSLGVRHTQNMGVTERSYQLYSGNVQFFIPLIPKISLAIKTGGATISGTPLFYQYPSIGESYNLRVFKRERFSGKSTFYNNTELRFISKIRSYLFNGKAGLLAFVDNGRVWMPGERSNKIHTAYGGGILIAPFNLVSGVITYGISNETKLLQFRLGMLF